MDKENASTDVPPPRSLTERLEAEARAHAAEAEVPAPSSMAERFAPESPNFGSSCPKLQAAATHLRASAAGRIAAPAQAAVPFVNRVALSLLVVMAIAPSLALALLYWHAFSIPEWMPLPRALAAKVLPQPPLREAVMASAVGTETVLAKRDYERPAVTLDVASTLSGDAGKPVLFSIGLDNAAHLPVRSIITIRGLPAGATFSAGRPYGETEWSLRPDEIGDLSLTLPKSTRGEHFVTIELIAGDGTPIANGATRLDIAPDPKAALISRPDEEARIDELLAHGHKMIDVGYFAGARSYFERAAEAGSADAALALGATYDPAFIAEIGAQGIPPDLAAARLWYERAKMFGSPLAEERIAALVQGSALPQGDDSMQPVAQMPAPDAAGEEEWVEVSGSVNVREGPAPQAKTIRVAERGMRYRATGRKGGWVQVTDPRTAEVGWIYSRFVEASRAP